MATAPGHLLGQIIGGLLEDAIEPELQKLADKHELYLDKQGPRPGVRPGRKVTWQDGKGNGHDLDFVLERGGSAIRRGNPAAFVEAAWRRYTKHSKAKAQEISGALDPVLATWGQVQPTGAAVVAGEWTAPALNQLRTNGYVVLHFNFTKTVAVFARHRVDIAGVGSDTSDQFWQRQCDRLGSMSARERGGLVTDLRQTMQSSLEAFAQELESRIIRRVDFVTVTPLHGDSRRFADLSSAIAAIESYEISVAVAFSFVRFEVRLVYTNGDVIQANFGTALDATAFLETFS